MQVKLIKTTQDYENALASIETLLSIEPTQAQSDELELLIYLVEKYENEVYPIDLPSPIDAIKFKMDQLGLKQKDLIPMIGSKSKVSEVLNGKRPLTLIMMRALHEKLGISAEVLLQKPNEEFPSEFSGMDFKKFPLAELYKREIIFSKNYNDHGEEIIHNLWVQAKCPDNLASCFRQGKFKNSQESTYALLTWELLVRIEANKVQLENKYVKENFTHEHLQRLANLSIHPDGALKAKEYLARHGIILVILESFKKAHVDGVAMLLDDGTPVIGLSLRHDRVDYFWFTLFHELGHIIEHLNTKNTLILDEFIVTNMESKSNPQNVLEDEANLFACNALVPEKIWNESDAKKTNSRSAILRLASQLDIHPGIIAGKIRRQRNNYTFHTQLLGAKTIRKQFGLG